MTAAAADELEHVLDTLLHDLRSPMGAAGGYLRLLREGRLPSAEDGDRAIGKAQDALRTMTALCAEAGEWLKEPPASTPVTVPARDLLDRVVAQAAAAGITVDGDGVTTDTVTLSAEADRVAATVVAVLRSAIGGSEARCSAGVGDGVLHVEANVAAKRDRTVDGPFDPWAIPGLTTALACRSLAQSGGRCRSGRAAGEVVRVEFDLTPA